MKLLCCILLLAVTHAVHMAVPAKSVNQVAREQFIKKTLDLGDFDAFTTIQAESFNYSEGGVYIEDCSDTIGALQVDYLGDGSVLGYYGVDFHDGAVRVDLRVATDDYFAPVGRINLHLDSTANEPFVSIFTRSTADYTWVTLSQYIPLAPTGIHDLYISFDSDDHDDSAYIVDFNWFQFHKD